MFSQKCCSRVCILGSLVAVGLSALLLSVPEAPGGDKKTIPQLVEQLGSKDFTRRETATRKLQDLGATALPALRRAATADDLEVRRRAGKLLVTIEEQVADRAADKVLAAAKEKGLGWFIDQLLADKKAEGPKNWRAFEKLVRTMGEQAAKLYGKKKFHIPALDTLKMPTVQELTKERRYKGTKLLLPRVPEYIAHLEGCVLVTKCPMPGGTMAHHSILLVNGGIESYTVIHDCIVICRGPIEQLTDLVGSVVLSTGPIQSVTTLNQNVLQIAGVEKTNGVKENIFVNMKEEQVRFNFPEYRKLNRFVQLQGSPVLGLSWEPAPRKGAR